jgi:radical SAM family uncharacterized protein/radical SAM-linked protein
MPKDYDLLSALERPSRYLGSEINAVRKDPRGVRLHVALAFPDLYEIGTSHFGMQILYSILNRRPDIAAERVFAPAPDLEALLRRTGRPLFSLESHRPLAEFDIVGFSLLYELNYTNVLTMLDLARIPRRAGDREDRHPLVIAGGPCTCNPEPMAAFFDALVIGDGETALPAMAAAWLAWKAGGGGRDREALLRDWSRIEGVYVPSFFEARIDRDGFQHLAPRRPDYRTVRRAIVSDLDREPLPARPVVPYGKPVHDRLRLEVSRGCTRGCRFCQAGMIYRPVRERSPRALVELAAEALAATGYEDLSLLSLSTGDYRCIGPLVAALMGRFSAERVAVSLPSLRAGTVAPELMELIRKVRKTGFTIAPEAGSQRLRDAINKNIGEAEIFETVGDAFRLGWKLVKLYFMIGLPTETREDIAALIDLVRRLRAVKAPGGGRGRLNVSVAAFIPKPHTPFQWAGQIRLEESREKLDWIEREIALPGVEFKWQNPQMSLLEGVFARGDRRLAAVLEAAHARGCRFDGWSDRFDFAAWTDAFEAAGVDPSFFTHRPRALDEPLPWAHIDSRVDLDFLKREWEKALGGGLTADCRDGDCQGCGVCDFDGLRPRTHAPRGREAAAGARAPAAPPPAAAPRRVTLCYEKLGPARFFGHLELVNLFLRALRRAGVRVKYSEGFHPKPRVAFDNPLPTGMESEAERMTVTVCEERGAEALAAALNAELPEGLRTFACPDGAPAAAPRACTYRVELPGKFPEAAGPFDPERPITVTSGKGKLKKAALKDILYGYAWRGPGTIELTMACGPGNSVRPVELLKQLLQVPEERLAAARIRKLLKTAAPSPR